MGLQARLGMFLLFMWLSLCHTCEDSGRLLQPKITAAGKQLVILGYYLPRSRKLSHWASAARLVSAKVVDTLTMLPLFCRNICFTDNCET